MTRERTYEGEGRALSPALTTWSLYGVRLQSDHTFENAVPRAAATAVAGVDELTFAYVEEPPLSRGWERAPYRYASRARIDDHTSFLYVLEVNDCTVLRFSHVVDFFVWPERILCRLLDPAYRYVVELHLLGFVMSYWLEARGILALHAAGVVVDAQAVGFLATNAGGKSALAASLMQAGHPLSSDDILAVERGAERPLARPSYPQMRMWPEMARHFAGTDALPQVHPNLSKRRVAVGPEGFGRFDDAVRPLAVLYLPERSDGGDVTFADLRFGEAAFALEQYAFLAPMLADTGLQQRRFTTLAAVAATVPLRRVRYPSGLERLPEVAAAIAEDAGETIARTAPATER